MSLFLQIIYDDVNEVNRGGSFVNRMAHKRLQLGAPLGSAYFDGGAHIPLHTLPIGAVTGGHIRVEAFGNVEKIIGIVHCQLNACC